MTTREKMHYDKPELKTLIDNLRTQGACGGGNSDIDSCGAGNNPGAQPACSGGNDFQ